MFDDQSRFLLSWPENQPSAVVGNFLNRRSFRFVVSLTTVMWIVLGGLRVLAEEEILAGHSAAGQLKVDIEFDPPFVLPRSVFPGITGYATGEMGFHSTILDDPANDFFQLSPSADFRMVLLAKDPGMEVWNDTGSGYMGVGESYYVGPPPFDTHPLWNIVNGVPGNTYSLTLKIIDLNGIYTESDPFELSFTPEFPPGPFQINIRPDDLQHATLLWTTNAIGWTLESAGSLVSPNWNTITNAPNISGTNFALTITTSAAQEFFRLRKP